MGQTLSEPVVDKVRITYFRHMLVAGNGSAAGTAEEAAPVAVTAAVATT